MQKAIFPTQRRGGAKLINGIKQKLEDIELWKRLAA